MFAAKESIVIVEAKHCGKYGKQLYTLIGTNDDHDGEIVGPVDGSVEASTFSEKHYAGTLLSSDQKIIFIGEPKVARDSIDAIKAEAGIRVAEHGIRIFVSGRQALISVEGNGLSREDYWAFLDYAKSHGQELDDLLSDLRPKEDSEKKKIAAPLAIVGKAASGVGERVAEKKKSGDIHEQQFRFAIRHFYLEYLRDFVEA